MENKLQELTKKLYDEGLSKGRQDADTLVADAKGQAKKIVADAYAEAEKIRREAQTKAEDLHKNTLTELNLAGKQAVSKLKSSIREMVVAQAMDGSVAKANMDPEFVKEVLVAVAKNWQGSSTDKVSLKAMLPAAMKEKFDANFARSVGEILSSGMEITYSDDLKSGFKVAPGDGGYYISFTDEGFNSLLGEYLRPRVSEMLFGTEDKK